MRSINLACAKLIIECFVNEAKALGTTGEISIVDSFANAVAYVRLDDYETANYSESLKLAKSAGAFAMPTEKLAEEIAPGQRFSHLQESSSYSVRTGGYPIIFKGEVVGAVGLLTKSEAFTKALAEALLGKLDDNPCQFSDDSGIA